MIRFLAASLIGVVVTLTAPQCLAQDSTSVPKAAFGDCRQEAPAEKRRPACTVIIDGGKVKGEALAFAYLQRGLALAETGDLESAIKDFDQALKLVPKATDALYDRGAANAQLNRWEAALADFDRLLKLAPKDADGLYMRAWVHSQMGKDKAAIADLDSVVTLFPDDQAALFDRGGLLLRAGRLKDAVRDFSRVLELDPKAAAAAFSRGRAQYLLKDYKKAADDFRLSLAILPNNPYAALRLHLALKRTGGNADKTLQIAASALSEDEWPKQLLLVYLGKMKGEDLLKALGQVPKEDQPRVLCEANYYLGAFATLEGQSKQAAAYYDAAIKTGAKSSIEFLDANLALSAR